MEFPFLAAAAVVLQRPIFAVSSSLIGQANTHWFYPDYDLNQEDPMLLGLRASSPGAHWMPFRRLAEADQSPLPEASAPRLASSYPSTTPPGCPPLASRPPVGSSPLGPALASSSAPPFSQGGTLRSLFHFHSYGKAQHVCCAPEKCSTRNCGRCRQEVGSCCLHARVDTLFQVASLASTTYMTCIACRIGRAADRGAVLMNAEEFERWDDDYHLSGTQRAHDSRLIDYVKCCLNDLVLTFLI